MSRVLLLVLLALASPALASAAPAPVAVTPDTIARGNDLSLDAGWLYRPGDDPGWADPALDDSAWEAILMPNMPVGKRPASGWPGIGWFRIHLAVDPALAKTPVALRLSHNGASEVYLDGRLVYTFGRVSASAAEEKTYDPNRLPLPIVFETAGEHVLAVRYSCAASGDGATSVGRVLTAGSIRAGFLASLGDAEQSTTSFVADMTATAVVMTLFIGILSAFGLLHLFLFLFYRRQRANLFYSLFAFSFALNSVLNFALNLTHFGYEPTAILAAAKPAAVAAIFLFFIAFLYAAFSLPVPKYFPGIVALWAVALVALAVVPARFNPGLLLSASIFVSISESILNVVRAHRRKLEGVWIINAGVQCYAGALTCELVQQIFGFQNPWLQLLTVAGFLGLPAFVSIYLAREFARKSRDLESKLVEVETLSADAIEYERREAQLRAENERKAQELEEARQLQLSMLPASVPELPGLEIAAYMKPATEVGGDYYDFHVAEDGTLTVAVGDATGHGLKAGTLVTATKGLFNAFAEEPDITGFFRRSSRALRRLNLRYLYMALMLAKLKDNRVRLSAAGMPPTLVFRAATGEVEEVAIRGLPLGGGAAFPYEERELTLEPGDTVVFMSDGFPERFNASGEMLDYDRARTVLAEVADRTPREIIEHFVRTADAWAAGHPQNDDVTFVVIKVDGAAA